jgi:hypothetical protein
MLDKIGVWPIIAMIVIRENLNLASLAVPVEPLPPSDEKSAKGGL